MQIITEEIIDAAANYNEAEVRFHIIDPIIRLLGYPGADNVYLNLEEKLTYPYFHIGRQSKNDLPLGFPDYRAGLKGARGSFIIEAKAGNVPISSREVEQAHSYAAHAQVGANYFVLCNGNVIAVYQTLSGSDVAPIASVPLAEVNERFYELENILSPLNLEKNCLARHDTDLKLAEGIGSTARIRSGNYIMSGYEYRLLMNGQDCTALFRQSVPQISTLDSQLELLKAEFDLRVSDGVVERCEDGRITAHVKFDGATISNYKAMEIMGIAEATFATADNFISINPDSPTIFESLKDFTVSRGTVMPELFGGSTTIEGDIKGNMFIKAAMFYSEGKLRGQYISLSDQDAAIPGAASPLHIEMDLVGTFELTLDV
jgi:Type I restriction enzyme R protein N terminus (HSDR_N)